MQPPAATGTQKRPTGGNHEKQGHKVYVQGNMPAGYQASQIKPVFEAALPVLLEGVPRLDAANPNARLNDGEWKLLKLRIWAWCHFMAMHAENLGDFLDRDERVVVANVLRREVPKQPLDKLVERKPWETTLGEAMANGRSIGYSSILLGAEHVEWFAQVLAPPRRGHPVQEPGVDVSSRYTVTPDYLRRLQAVVERTPLVVAPLGLTQTTANATRVRHAHSIGTGQFDG